MDGSAIKSCKCGWQHVAFVICLRLHSVLIESMLCQELFQRGSHGWMLSQAASE